MPIKRYKFMHRYSTRRGHPPIERIDNKYYEKENVQDKEGE